MTKTILKVAGLAVCLTAAVLANTSINAETENRDVTLESLTKTADANAECPSNDWTNNGNCSTLTGNCYALKTPYNCDSTKPRYW